MISPLVKWNHENDHLVPAYDPATRSDKRNLSLTLSDPKYEFMKGHAIDSKFVLINSVEECHKLTVYIKRSSTSTCNWISLSGMGNFCNDEISRTHKTCCDI